MNRDWMKDATCRDHDPDLFFPSEKEAAALAHRQRKGRA